MYTPLNLNVYSAAFSGAIAGMCNPIGAAIIDPTSADYAPYANTANIWAQAVDIAWGDIIIPNEYDIDCIQNLSTIYHSGHPANYQSAADWQTTAIALVAAIRAGNTKLTTEGITPPSIPITGMPQQQTEWRIDAYIGDDNAIGDNAHPLRTLSEWWRRTANSPLVASTTVTIHGEFEADDPLIVNHLNVASFFADVILTGEDIQIVKSATVTTFTAQAGNTPNILTSADISDWTPYVGGWNSYTPPSRGCVLQLTSGANEGAIAFVAQALSGPARAVTTRWYIDSWEVYPSPGDTFEVRRQSRIVNYTVCPQSGSFTINNLDFNWWTTDPQHVIGTMSALGASANSVVSVTNCTVDDPFITGRGVIVFTGCFIPILFQAAFDSPTYWYGGAMVRQPSPWFPSRGIDCFNTVIRFGEDGPLLVSIPAIIEGNSYAEIMSAGLLGDTTFDIITFGNFMADNLWGTTTANNVLSTDPTGRISLISTNQTVTGAVKDVSVNGTGYVWADLPKLDATSFAGALRDPPAPFRAMRSSSKTELNKLKAAARIVTIKSILRRPATR